MNDSLNYNYWRSGRDSNPRPPPWQGGILTSWTTRPVIYLNGGSGRNRTTDTRIFSPLLYRLSYGTIIWRSGRDSNPRPPPWQGGILTSWTTRPVIYLNGGSGRNRTTDTRIFSPLLYRLSYGTIIWRSGRDSNPRPPPWQGGILTNWTTRPKNKNGGDWGIRTPAGR